MAQEVRVQLEKTINYTANAKVTEQLSRGMIYRELWLRLQGQLTVSAANNTQANTRRGDEWRAISRIELIANGSDVIKSFDGNSLWWHNYFWYGCKPRVATALGDGSTLNPAFDTVLILPLWMPRSIRPIDTALDSRELSSLDIAITWGSHLDINALATGFTVAPTLRVHSLKSFGVAGPFSTWRVYTIERDITATNPKLQIQLPVGKMYRGFLCNMLVSDADNAAVLNNFKLYSGSTIFTDLAVQDDTGTQIGRLRNGIGLDFNGQTYDDLRIGVNNSVEGWFWYDHVTDGRLTECIDTLGFSEFAIEADVTLGGGTTKLIIYPQEITPIRAA